MQKILSSRLTPPSADEARLRIEVTKSVNANIKPMATLVFGLFFGAFALQWVAWPYAVTWAVLIAGYPIATYPLRRRIFNAEYRSDQSVEFLVKAAALMMPLHVVWAAYVPMCWIDGNPTNNAFLVIFMLACLMATVQLYGSCLFLSLPAFIIFTPVIVTHYLRTGSPLDGVLPAVQMLFCIVLATTAFKHFVIFRQSFIRRLTIEKLAAELKIARDEALAANRAKSAFLAGMSHELRTPLNAIIGFSDLIGQEIVGPISPPKYREYVGDIHSSGVHLLTLINDLLDLSKIEAGKKELQNERTEISTLTNDVLILVRPQADAAGIVIATDLAPGVALFADRRAIGQILINFLSNAVKYSPHGATVTLFARRKPDGGLDLGVDDHGIGMDEEGLRKALEPYGQASHMITVEGKGTGLGLPIAKALIELHGAVFHIESVAGRGTEVWGEFPPRRVMAAEKAA
jgi:signal transduction histidine kinase